MRRAAEKRRALIGGASDLGAGGKGELAFLGVEIDAHDAAAIGAAQLHGELPEQAETDHRHAHAELKARLAHALQRDGADRACACRLETHIVGHRCHQRARHGVVFGVGGHGLADAGDAIANAKLVDLRADRGHHSGAAIAECRRRFQALLDLAYRGHESLILEGLDHLPHLVWPLAGLGGKIHPGLGHLHLLGAHADEGEMRADEDFVGMHAGKRNLAGPHGAAAQKLSDLLHGAWITAEADCSTA